MPASETIDAPAVPRGRPFTDPLAVNVEPQPGSVPAPEPLHPGWLALSRQIETVLSKKLFFVIGCQRSGTTWLAKLLNAHPDIACKGEACFGTVLLRALRGAANYYNENQRGGPELNLRDEHLAYLFVSGCGLIFANMLAGRDVQWLGEKTPEHAMCIPLLANLFPTSKFIHIIRDGRDGAVSGWLYNQAEKGEAILQKFPRFADYVSYYVREHWTLYIKTAREAANAIPGRYMEVRYEDLHRAPLGHLARLLNFLGADAGADRLTACVNAASFEKLSGGRARGDADAKSFYRKGIIGDWKNHFDKESLAAFMTHGGTMLRNLGYE